MKMTNLLTGVLLLALGAQVNAFAAEDDPFVGKQLTDMPTPLSGKQDLAQRIRQDIDFTRDYWLSGKYSDEDLMHSQGDFFRPLRDLAKQISEANAILNRQDDEIDSLINLMNEANSLSWKELSSKEQLTSEEKEKLQEALSQVNILLQKAEEMIDILSAK